MRAERNVLIGEALDLCDAVSSVAGLCAAVVRGHAFITRFHDRLGEHEAGVVIWRAGVLDAASRRCLFDGVASGVTRDEARSACAGACGISIARPDCLATVVAAATAADAERAFAFAHTVFAVAESVTGSLRACGIEIRIGIAAETAAVTGVDVTIVVH